MISARSLGAEGGPMKQMDNESEHKLSDRRNNTGGYSWWKWRRSTDSQEKKPPKDADDEKNKSIDISETEMKETPYQPMMAASENIDNTDQELDVPEFASPIDYQLRDISSEPFKEIPLDGSKHDDSITAELDVANRNAGGAVEKYRKTLRLTSDQIVSIR